MRAGEARSGMAGDDDSSDWARLAPLSLSQLQPRAPCEIQTDISDGLERLETSMLTWARSNPGVVAGTLRSLDSTLSLAAAAPPMAEGDTAPAATSPADPRRSRDAASPAARRSPTAGGGHDAPRELPARFGFGGGSWLRELHAHPSHEGSDGRALLRPGSRGADARRPESAPARRSAGRTPRGAPPAPRPAARPLSAGARAGAGAAAAAWALQARGGAPRRDPLHQIKSNCDPLRPGMNGSKDPLRPGRGDPGGSGAGGRLPVGRRAGGAGGAARASAGAQGVQGAPARVPPAPRAARAPARYSAPAQGAPPPQPLRDSTCISPPPFLLLPLPVSLLYTALARQHVHSRPAAAPARAPSQPAAAPACTPAR